MAPAEDSIRLTMRIDVDGDKIQQVQNFQLQLRMASIIRSLTLGLLMVLMLMHQDVWMKLESFALKTWCYLSFPIHALTSTLFVTMSYRTKMSNLKNCQRWAFLFDFLMFAFAVYGMLLRNSKEVLEFERLTDSAGTMVFVVQAMAIVSGGPMIFSFFQVMSVGLKACMTYLFECKCVPPILKKKREMQLNFWLKRHRRPFTQVKNSDSNEESSCPICMLGF